MENEREEADRHAIVAKTECSVDGDSSAGQVRGRTCRCATVAHQRGCKPASAAQGGEATSTTRSKSTSEHLALVKLCSAVCRRWMAVVRAHVDGLQRTAQPAANRRRCCRCRRCRRCRRVGGTQGRIAADKPARGERYQTRGQWTEGTWRAMS